MIIGDAMASAITFCRLRSSVSGCSSDDRYSVDAVSPISNSQRSSFIEHQLEDEGDDVIGLVSAVTTATGAKQTSQSATHRFVFESNKRLRWSGCCSVVEHRAHLSALFISVAIRAITASGTDVADIDGKSAPSPIKAPSQ